MLKNTQNTQVLNTLISLYDLGSRPSYKSPKIAKKKQITLLQFANFFGIGIVYESIATVGEIRV